MLILNGSYIGMMEETVLSYNAPLYGVKIAQYPLEPLEFVDAQQFFLSYTVEDRLRHMQVAHGEPIYKLFNRNNHCKPIFSRDIDARSVLLYDEVRFILQQELREPRTTLPLQAIYPVRTSELNKPRVLENITYLETFQQPTWWRESFPLLNHSPIRAAGGVYRSRTISASWFRFVLPNHSIGTRRERSSSLIQLSPGLDKFTSTYLNIVCRQYFWRNGLNGKLPLCRSRSILVAGNEELISLCLVIHIPCWSNVSGVDARSA